MNKKYAGMIQPGCYWERLLPADAPLEAYRELVLALLGKIDELNERVYEASVRAEDAYQEMLRLRKEYQAQMSDIRQQAANK